MFGGRLVKFTQVHWLGKEFHATVLTQKFAKITICFCSVHTFLINAQWSTNLKALNACTL